MTRSPGEGEFYVGWQPKAPPRLGRRTVWTAAVLLGFAAASALVLVRAQNPFPPAFFEFGIERELGGRLLAGPHPALDVPRPGRSAGAATASTYLLVAPGKFGASSRVRELAEADPYGRRGIRLRGSLIYRGGDTMVEVAPGSPGPAEAGLQHAPSDVSLGVHTLRGEIVDGKCFLGVMNPGQLKPHRQCAVRCISGGVPPLLHVRDREGRSVQLLLVGEDGRSINDEVLDLVAEPIEITGRVERHGDLLLLLADPAGYRRL